MVCQIFKTLSVIIDNNKKIYDLIILLFHIFLFFITLIFMRSSSSIQFFSNDESCLFCLDFPFYFCLYILFLQCSNIKFVMFIFFVHNISVTLFCCFCFTFLYFKFHEIVNKHLIRFVNAIFMLIPQIREI